MGRTEKASYLDHVYEIVRMEFLGMDAVYKDYILHCVGVFGLNALLDAKLLEPCGVVERRQLYTLLEKK